MEFKSTKKQSGYDNEELYFEKLNRELIAKLKKEEEEKANSNVIAFPSQSKKSQDKKAA